MKAIFILLGINDSLASTTLSVVESDINSLVTRLQSDFPDTDIIFFQPGRNNSGQTTVRLAAIRRYIKNACVNNARVYLLGGYLLAGPAGLTVDNIHLNQTGQNHMGATAARWFDNSSYSKWARSIIASHLDDLSTERKALIASIDENLESYLNHECLYNFKTTTKNNFYLDWSFLTVFNDVSPITFTANDSVSTDGISTVARPGYVPLLSSLLSSQDDIFVSLKLKTVSTGVGTSSVAFGAANASGVAIMIFQGTTNVRYRINDASNTDYLNDNKLQDNTEYIVARNGGTKYLFKNGVEVHNAAVASTGNLDVSANLGGHNNNGVAGSFINASYEYLRAGKHVGTDHATFYAFMETLINNWNG